MNIEDQKKSQKLQSNILKFPGAKNAKVNDQQKEFARVLGSITIKMNKDDWNIHPITHTELSILSNHGETIEFAPLTAARLNSVLATQLINNSFMEDFI